MSKGDKASIIIRLSTEDKEYIKAQAVKANVSINEYVCRAALGTTVQNLEPYQKALKAHGQIMYFANTSNDPMVRKFLREACDSIWQSLK